MWIIFPFPIKYAMQNKMGSSLTQYILFVAPRQLIKFLISFLIFFLIIIRNVEDFRMKSLLCFIVVAYLLLNKNSELRKKMSEQLFLFSKSLKSLSWLQN